MKIAIISDIHGNLLALDCVLQAIEVEQPDHIVCLGDVIALGPQPAQVLARLRAIDCPVVMGNCDAWFAQWPLDEEDGLTYAQVRWAAEQLSSADFEYIRGFQLAIRLPLGDDGALLCFHGSLRSNTEVIVATTPEDELDATLAGVDATIAIGGHTHIQMVRRHRGMIAANAGSVGLPRNLAVPGGHFWHPRWAEWAMIEDARGHLSISLRRTPLDVDALIEAARATDMPGVEGWIADWRREMTAR